MVPRGEHNRQQVILLLEEDGEYRGVRACVDTTSSWHFNKHMPAHHSEPPKSMKQFNERAETLRISGLRRNPLVEIDHWGIPTHLDQPPGLLSLPRGIKSCR